MKSIKRVFLLLFGVLGCILFVGLLFMYANYAFSPAEHTFPRVVIDKTFPEGSGVVNQPVIVFGQASDPDGIASTELWINGEKIASQINTESNLYPFNFSQVWIPDGPGNYLFFLRGIDRKGFASESPPVLIQVEERTYQPNPAIAGQYFVKEEDTIEGIAARFGTTPDDIRRINPELVNLLAAESILVPPSPESAPGEDSDSLPIDEGAEPPHVLPPALPSPEGGVPAVPAPAPWWGFLPLPDRFDCLLNPALCAIPIDGETTTSPASDVHASLGSDCQVSLNWTDNSTNEVGFRVYRIVTRPRLRVELVTLLEPFPASGGRLNYVVSPAPIGESYYAVAVINLRGEEIWSAPSEKMTTTCSPSSTGSERILDVEALEMEIIDSSIERLYCYLSLAGSPFERIPQSTREFMIVEGGAWNIAEYAGGDNKRALMVDETSPLQISAECLGWQGGTLVDLGSFTRLHPPEEWDGRPLAAGPDDGAFRVAYRIEPTDPTETSAGYGGGGVLNPTVPIPFNVRATDSWMDCRYPTVGADSVCTVVNEPGLAWDYEIDLTDPRPPLYFNVYKHIQTPGAGSERVYLYYTTLDGTHMRAPLGNDCGEHVYYSVKAVTRFDSIYGGETFSGRSEALEIQPTCVTLEITLVSLVVYGVDDGAPCTIFADCAEDYEAYGVFHFDRSSLIWNHHCDHGLCGGGTSSTYTLIDEASRYNWAAMSLRKGSGRFSRGNNIIRIPFRDRERVMWSFNLMDHDDASADGPWCGFGVSHDLLPKYYTLDEMLTLDEDKLYQDTNRDSGGTRCDILLHLRGIPGSP